LKKKGIRPTDEDLLSLSRKISGRSNQEKKEDPSFPSFVRASTIPRNVEGKKPQPSFSRPQPSTSGFSRRTFQKPCSTSMQTKDPQSLSPLPLDSTPPDSPVDLFPDPQFSSPPSSPEEFLSSEPGEPNKAGYKRKGKEKSTEEAGKKRAKASLVVRVDPTQPSLQDFFRMKNSNSGITFQEPSEEKVEGGESPPSVGELSQDLFSSPENKPKPDEPPELLQPKLFQPDLLQPLPFLATGLTTPGNQIAAKGQEAKEMEKEMTDMVDARDPPKQESAHFSPQKLPLPEKKEEEPSLVTKTEPEEKQVPSKLKRKVSLKLAKPSHSDPDLSGSSDLPATSIPVPSDPFFGGGEPSFASLRTKGRKESSPAQKSSPVKEKERDPDSRQGERGKENVEKKQEDSEKEKEDEDEEKEKENPPGKEQEEKQWERRTPSPKQKEKERPQEEQKSTRKGRRRLGMRYGTRTGLRSQEQGSLKQTTLNFLKHPPS